jgi:hypothetical protein
MGFVNHLFTPEQLAALDEKQRQILREAVVQQLQTSPEIRGILNKMLSTKPEGRQS